MNCRLIAVLVILLAFCARTPAQQAAVNFAELETTISDELKATNIPGAAVAVVIGDRVVFAKGFGVENIETGTSVTPDTLFRIASTTKMLTAAALVALAERGKVKLDAPIGTYVKGLSPKLSRVTVHQLLSHTAGVRDGFSFNGPHDDDALAKFVSSWNDDYFVAEPGEIFSYSNLGYALAGRVIEKVSGKPYADAMNEVLFEPLGMRRSTLRPIMAMTYPMAQGHDGQTSLSIVRPFADDSRFWANGGVFTSISDYSRFAIAFLNDGRIDGKQVISPAGISKLSTPYVDMPGGNADENPRHAYGLNVRDYRGVRVLQHGGLRVGFGSLVRIVPEHRFAVIILTNKSNGLLMRSFEKATELVVPLKPRSTPTPRQPLVITDAELKKYAGVYQNAPDYLRLELVADGRKLFLTEVGATARSDVIKVGDSKFSAGGQEFLLIDGVNGKTKYMHIAGHALKKMS